ncbi:MAG: CinA family protein [Xanthomonadales bacterium]|nr:CinA family protein [Xanthomonadales bacterium]
MSNDPTETPSLHQIAADLGSQMLARRLKLAVAESCTGGWVCKVVTEISGSSDWFDAGFVAYSYEAKEAMLGVDRRILERYGAVSEEAVLEMVRGALSRSRANVALAITGIAGPTGGTPDKPVGTVWVAWGFGHHPPEAAVFLFSGDREQVRRDTVRVALRGVQEMLERH